MALVKTMVANLKIKLIQENDLENLAELYCKVYSAFDVGERWNKESAYRLLKYWFKRQPELCFLAEHNGQVVGAFVAGIKPWWDGNHLVDGEVFVDPDYQKKGVGTELSKVMYRTAIEKFDAKCFDAITFRHTEYPLSWYKKQGFSELETWTIISGDLRIALDNLEKGP